MFGDVDFLMWVSVFFDDVGDGYCHYRDGGEFVVG